MSGQAPLVLAIDTCLDACSVALARGDALVAERCEEMQRGQAERLAPMTRELVEHAQLDFSQIDRIAVTTGPGSFTGVRVGLSFARALALALDKPCLGVTSLEVLALERGEAGLRAAIIETPGGAYVALYDDGVASIPARAAERADARPLIEAETKGKPFDLVGPGAAIDVAAFARRAARLDPDRYPPRPAYLRAPHVTPPAAGAA